MLEIRSMNSETSMNPVGSLVKHNKATLQTLRLGQERELRHSSASFTMMVTLFMTMKMNFSPHSASEVTANSI